MEDEPADMTKGSGWRRESLFGIWIHAMRMGDVLSVVDDTISRRGRLLIGVVNAAKLVNMRRSKLLRESVLSSDLVLADGMAVVWAMRLLGRRLPERVAGIDLMLEMLSQGRERGYRVYCFGATDDVSRATVDRIERDYPGVVVAGRRDGYFEPEQEADIVRGIRESEADILFVAMSPPKKEQFLARWFDELGVPVCHGVGGAFDVMAGKTKRAPVLWQRMGLEWLYRIVQEPRRMWKRYLVTNTLFGWMLMGELVGRVCGRGTPQA